MKKKAVDGVCCDCGYSGTKKQKCPNKKDGESHCLHWWEGDSETPGPTKKRKP